MNQLIQSFFRQLEPDEMSYPDMLATHYLNFLYENPEAFMNVEGAEVISVPNDFSLDKASKRGLILSGKIAIVQQTKTPVMFSQESSSNTAICRKYIHTSSLEALGKWIAVAKDFLINEKITYVPNGFTDTEEDPGSKLIVVGQGDIDQDIKRKIAKVMGASEDFSYIQTYEGKELNSFTKRASITPDSVFSAAKLRAMQLIGYTHPAILCSDSKLKKETLQKILSINIPSFDGIPLDQLAPIMLENEESFSNFSSYLRTLTSDVENIDKCTKERIRHEIQLQIQDLQNIVSRANRNLAMSQAVIAGGVAAALMTSNMQLNQILAILLGIGMIEEGQAIANYLDQRDDITNNPVHFLWLLGKHK